MHYDLKSTWTAMTDAVARHALADQDCLAARQCCRLMFLRDQQCSLRGICGTAMDMPDHVHVWRNRLLCECCGRDDYEREMTRPDLCVDKDGCLCIDQRHRVSRLLATIANSALHGRVQDCLKAAEAPCGTAIQGWL